MMVMIKFFTESKYCVHNSPEMYRGLNTHISQPSTLKLTTFSLPFCKEDVKKLGFKASPC